LKEKSPSTGIGGTIKLLNSADNNFTKLGTKCKTYYLGVMFFSNCSNLFRIISATEAHEWVW
jgi:hypothetical protein